MTIKRTARLPAVVALATTDLDFGLLPGAKALPVAVDLAAEFKQTVYLRDPVTDQVLQVVKPPKR